MWKNQVYFSIVQGSWMLRDVMGQETRISVEEARKLCDDNQAEDKTPEHVEKCIPPSMILFT